MSATIRENLLVSMDDEYAEPTHRVIAVAGRVEKLLFEGSYDECEFFADDHYWQWSETPGGFIWDLEVEEI